MSQNQEVKVVGPSFMTLLFLVFLVLKLTGYITWSWWWVTLPLWAPFVVFFVVLICALMFAGLVALGDKALNK